MWVDDIRSAQYRRRLDSIISQVPDGIRPL
jgi:hypothetical protein